MFPIKLKEEIERLSSFDKVLTTDQKQRFIGYMSGAESINRIRNHFNASDDNGGVIRELLPMPDSQDGDRFLAYRLHVLIKQCEHKRQIDWKWLLGWVVGILGIIVAYFK